MQAVFRPFEIEAFEAQMDSDQDSNQLNIDQAETGSNSSDSGVNSGSGKLKFKVNKIWKTVMYFWAFILARFIEFNRQTPFLWVKLYNFRQDFFPNHAWVFHNQRIFITLGFYSALKIQHGKYTI